MNSFRFKLKAKLLSYHLLGILTLLIILLVAYFNNRLLETIICIICFFIYRPLYDKQYHSKSLINCALISLIVFTILSYVALSVHLSILMSIMLTFILTNVSYYVKDYIDLQILKFKTKKTKIDECSLETLINVCDGHIDKEYVKIVYDYLHRKLDETADDIALKTYVSRRTLFNYVKKCNDIYSDYLKRLD